MKGVGKIKRYWKIIEVEKMEEPSRQEEMKKQPRPYQLELLEKAKEENSIIYLGTGSGKTFIAAMMIKEFGHQLRDKKIFKRTIFLGNSVALVKQQAAFLGRHSGFKCRSFCGADDVDNWSREKWLKEIEENQILVMVHQVFLDILNKGFFGIEQVNLLIIDEVHHTAKNHVYNQIMRIYHQHKQANRRVAVLPRILGLTASVVTEQCSFTKFKQLMDELEINTDCKVITTEENLASILEFVTSPEESFESYNSTNNRRVQTTVGTFIDEGCSAIYVLEDNRKMRLLQHLEEGRADKMSLKIQLESVKSRAKEAKNLLQDLGNTFNTLGIYPAEQLVNFYNEDLLPRKINMADDLFHRNLYQTVSAVTQKIKIEITRICKNLSEHEKLEQLSTDKVLTLLKILEEQGEECRQITSELDCLDDLDEDFDKLKDSRSPNMVAIVFVDRRQTATALCQVLKAASKLRPRLNFLKVGVTMGKQARGDYKNKSPDQADKEADKELEDTLDKFRKSDLNCLVSTNVLEEGIDIKTCNLVVRFDFIPNFRSYVQAKGRARAKPSKYVIMVDIEELEMMRVKVSEFQNIEKNSVMHCHGRSRVEIDHPTANHEVEEYFVNPEDPLSARVTSDTAIGKVSHYVQTLPSDKFADLCPIYELKESGVGYSYTLQLPLLTPIVDPIQGPVKRSKSLAKKAVAFLACKMLHQLGALDDLLKPKKMLLEEDEDEDSESLGEGTKRKKNYYVKELPAELNCLDLAGPKFLYRIKVIPAEFKDTFDPEVKLQKLGVIIGAKLPREATGPFHLYSPSRQVLTQLEFVKEIDNLSRHDLDLILAFQDLVFSDVLKHLNPPWMKLDASKSNPELLLLPIIGREIDFRFLTSKDDPPGRNPFVFNQSLYENAVVVPKHRGMERCFVTAVEIEMTPLSLISKMQKNFQDYYKEKYGKTLTNLEQPLLRVNSADKKYDDMHNPIQRTSGSCKNKMLKTDQDCRFLIPELVEVHKIPAAMWQECQLLPFILNRISKILQVGKFREKFLLQSSAIDQHRDEFEPIDFRLKSQPNAFEKLLKVPETDEEITCPSIDELVRPLTASGAGESFDLEKEEILGDSFLKYWASIHLFFVKDEMRQEGQLTAMRSKIVGNKNLFRRAKDLNLPKMFSASKLVPRKNWRPPRFTQPEILEKTLCQKDLEMRAENPKRNRSLFDLITIEQASSLILSKDEIDEEVFSIILSQIKTKDDAKDKNSTKSSGFEPRDHCLISDKSLADAIESLIGCFLRESGQKGAVEFMGFLGLAEEPYWFSPPRNAFHRHVDPSTKEERFKMLLQKVDTDLVETKLGYVFKEKSFLLQAFTHCSYVQNRITDSLERLEFLGDAVLDYLVTCHLFAENSDTLTPGEVTDLRSALVCNNTLAKLAVDSMLHTQLLHNSPKILAKIDEYAAHLSSSFMGNLELHNEEDCSVMDDVDVPKVLGDLLEAVLGAVFLDSGFDLLSVWKAFKRIFPDMEEVIALKPTNPVKQLMERFPEKVEFVKKERKEEARKSCVVVRVRLEEEAMVFAGVGSNFKRAKQAAAKCAIVELKRKGLY